MATQKEIEAARYFAKLGGKARARIYGTKGMKEMSAKGVARRRELRRERELLRKVEPTEFSTPIENPWAQEYGG